MARTIIVLALAGLVTACSAGSPADPGSAPSPTGDPERWREAPGQEPYPFVTPIPPLAKTPVDGLYRRNYPGGSDPIPCRRCAPYRLDRGEGVLTLQEGRFSVDQPASAFRSGGHFFVDGRRLILINDPNCPRTRGVYNWTRRGGVLTLEVVEDDCAFDLLRARYLSAAPWMVAA